MPTKRDTQINAVLEPLGNIPTEEQEQAALFQWAALQSGAHPELQLLFHIPNGGYRSKATAGRMKGQGVKAGVPDLFLPVVRGGFAGLFIEMKRVSGGKLSKVQKEWLFHLSKEGYRAVRCDGWEEAEKEIRNYLGW